VLLLLDAIAAIHRSGVTAGPQDDTVGA
jgi:hypothetical protein